MFDFRIILSKKIMLNFGTTQPSNKTNIQDKQFPLYFANPLVDSISKALTAFGNTQPQRIIYMGPRSTSNYKLFKSFSTSEISNQTNKIIHPQIYSQKQIEKYTFNNNQKQKYYPVRSCEYRLFNGINPTLKKQQLHFDSYFQCGNLDLVVSLGNNQYDLFMRVDSNTKGHTCWFFYKITNFTHKQKIKMNISNFSRSELSYSSGMKIYTYTSSSGEWRQQGQNIKFHQSTKCKYSQSLSQQINSRYYTLSFQYQFKGKDQYVYFSYCIPYSYSYLQLKIREIQKMYYKIVEVDRSNLSTGGLTIPIITITNYQSNSIKTETEEKDQRKGVCLIIGRTHPGQTQASWILQGFIHYLCSSKAKQLRDKLIFKIIPMVNVDGVIAGNFRTNLLGRDINRFFNQPQLLSEISLIRSMAARFAPFMFLDFHGHSSKKNIFTYGPDYSIDHQYFIPSRLFSKIISKSTKTFRYYACNFRLDQGKKSTGRAIMLRNHQVKYCFTFQASAHAFGHKRQQVFFDRNQFLDSGSMIGCGLDNYIKIIFTLPKRYQINSIQESHKKVKSTRILPVSSEINQLSLSAQNKKLLQEILKDEKQHFQIKKKQEKEDSDFQEGNDYTQKQLRQMLNGEKQVINRIKNDKKSAKKPLFHDKSLKNPKFHTNHEQINQFLPQIQQKNAENTKKYKYKNHVKHLSTQLERQDTQIILNQSLPLQNDKGSRLKILSHKIFSQDSCIIFQDPQNIKNHPNINLDYQINKANSEYLASNQIKRMKQKTSIMLKRRYRIKQPKLPQTTQRQKKEDIAQIKKSLLPLLRRSNNAKRQDHPSVISQIFQNRVQSRSNRYSKNIRLFHS